MLKKVVVSTQYTVVTGYLQNRNETKRLKPTKIKEKHTNGTKNC